MNRTSISLLALVLALFATAAMAGQKQSPFTMKSGSAPGQQQQQQQEQQQQEQQAQDSQEQEQQSDDQQQGGESREGDEQPE